MATSAAALTAISGLTRGKKAFRLLLGGAPELTARPEFVAEAVGDWIGDEDADALRLATHRRLEGLGRGHAEPRRSAGEAQVRRDFK